MATEDRARRLGPAFNGLLQATAISNLGDGIRLAALPLGLTLLSILAGSLVNRVMVVELGLPVILHCRRRRGKLGLPENHAVDAFPNASNVPAAYTK